MKLPTTTAVSRPAALQTSWQLKPFDFHAPTRVVFGPGSLAKLGEIARELGDTRVLLVTDPGLQEAGHPQRAMASTHEAGLDAFLLDGAQQNPTDQHVPPAGAAAPPPPTCAPSTSAR